MKCDRLNDCGDDPWLKIGKAEPCVYYIKREQQAAADVLWASLVSFDREFNGPKQADHVVAKQNA